VGYDFNERTPIYQQIVEEIKKQIVTEKLNGGDKMPSVRELSQEMDVNPNTVQRAYQELERQNITFSQRGMGTFVSEDIGIKQKIKNEMAELILLHFWQGMNSLGISKEEIIKSVTEYLEREDI